MRGRLLTPVVLLLGLALFWPTSVQSYQSGVSGRTLKTSTSGCGSCHGNSPSSSVIVQINGPNSVIAGQKASFTVTVTGASGSAGGVDIAARNGALSPVSTYLQLSGGELIHNTRVSVPSTYQFDYTAPSSPGTDTIYATGKDNNMSSWNWAPNRAVTVTAAPAPAPPVPVLASPANGSSNQPTTLTLSWNASAGATSYRLQVSAQQNFGSTVFDDSTLTGTSQQVGPLSNGSTYYWRVRAKNAGGSSAYSGAWNFATVVAPPPVPVLASPANGSSNQPTTLTLSWNASSGATSYRLQVSAQQNFGSTVFDDSTLTGTSRQVGPLSNGSTYYWRVSGKNAGGSSAYSGAWNFATVAAPTSPPPVPVLASPADGSSNQPTTLTLSWNASSGATSYRLQASDDQTFASTVFDDSTLTGTSQEVGPLSNGSTYYWRVRAKNGAGSSDYSAAWSFATALEPPTSLQVPTLVSPRSGSRRLSTPVQFMWEASPGAINYQLQVSQDSQFGDMAVNDSSLSDTSEAVSSLKANTRYFWRVRAMNSTSQSQFSEVWRLTTIRGLPCRPDLAEPGDGARELGKTIRFSWRRCGDSGSDADSYVVHISSDSAFSSVFFADSVVGDTSKEVSGLDPNVTYYWRVQGVNEAGVSEWSVYRQFSTASLTGDVGPSGEPTAFQLEQNYPNPFNPSTQIAYSLPAGSWVTLTIFDVLGNEMKRLVDEWQGSGRYQVRVEAEGFASGVYFYQLRAGGSVQTKRLVLLR